MSKLVEVEGFGSGTSNFAFDRFDLEVRLLIRRSKIQIYFLQRFQQLKRQHIQQLNLPKQTKRGGRKPSTTKKAKQNNRNRKYAAVKELASSLATTALQTKKVIIRKGESYNSFGHSKGGRTVFTFSEL